MIYHVLYIFYNISYCIKSKYQKALCIIHFQLVYIVDNYRELALLVLQSNHKIYNSWDIYKHFDRCDPAKLSPTH